MKHGHSTDQEGYIRQRLREIARMVLEYRTVTDEVGAEWTRYLQNEVKTRSEELQVTRWSSKGLGKVGGSLADTNHRFQQENAMRKIQLMPPQGYKTKEAYCHHIASNEPSRMNWIHLLASLGMMYGHTEFYHLPEATIQVAMISKVLLSLEKGDIKGLSGKSLNDVQLESDEGT